MAKRLKNLKPKRYKKMGFKYKCEYCVHYNFSASNLDGPYGNSAYNKCTKKNLIYYPIEKQKFCKYYKSFNSLLNNDYDCYFEDEELPF